MKRSTWTGQNIVWHYGCPSWATLPDEAERQLRLAHELREHLVEVWHDHEAAVQAAWATRPEVATAQAMLDEADEAVIAALKAATDERQSRKERRVSRETNEAVRAARLARRDARTALRAAKNAAYADLAPSLHDLIQGERDARKAAYADYVQGRGLYWGTYKTVVDHHDMAVERLVATRKAGRPANMRHHRYGGTGVLAVQLQRKARHPARTAGVLSSGQGTWRDVLSLPAVVATDPREWGAMSRAERRRAAQATIRLRLGTGEDGVPVWCEVPVVAHRPLPPEADVTGAELIVTRVAGHRRLGVNLTLRIPVPEAAAPGACMCALDIGWRGMPDGSIRVGYFRLRGRPRKPLAVPEHLRDVIVLHDDGYSGQVRVPASWRDLADRTEGIHSVRSKDLERVKADLAAWLAERPTARERIDAAVGALRDSRRTYGAAEEPADAGLSRLARWRSPRRMATLTRDWAQVAEKGDEEILAILEAWRVRDRHLWEWWANERDQLKARRRDAWRTASALLACAASVVVVERAFVGRVVRAAAPEEEDSYQAKAARALHELAAPAELAVALVQAASRRGVQVVEVDASATTRTHWMCGCELPPSSRSTTTLKLWCPTCDVSFDQDANAVANLLDRAGTARAD